MKWKPYHFMNCNLELIDQCLASKHSYDGITERELYSYDEHEHVLQIICDYLPIYNYNDEAVSNRYLVMEGSATAWQGVGAALDCLRKPMNK